MVLVNPHHGPFDLSVRHAARLKAADVPNPVPVALPEGRPSVFTLDTGRAFLADHPDLKLFILPNAPVLMPPCVFLPPLVCHVLTFL
jgi:hypothetical protein